MVFDPYDVVARQCGRDTRLTGARHAWALTGSVVLPAALAAQHFGRPEPVEGLVRTELRLVAPGHPAPGVGAMRIQAAFRATTVFEPDAIELCSLMGKPWEATLRAGDPLGVDHLELTLLVPAHLGSRSRLEEGTWECHPFLDRHGRRLA